MSIDKKNPIPIYFQVKDKIFEKIETGDRLPSRMIFYEKRELEYHFGQVSSVPKVPAEKFRRPEQEIDLHYGDEIMH